jgi:porphobilinogen synthase
VEIVVEIAEIVEIVETLTSIGIHRLEAYHISYLEKVSELRGKELDCYYYTELFKSINLQKRDLIFPIFVSEKSTNPFPEGNAVSGLAKIVPKGIIQYVQNIIEKGISSVIIFGIPKKRDLRASSALRNDGIVQRSTREIKKEFGEMINIITDVCICQYNLSGHCGLQTGIPGKTDGIIDNDSTLALLSEIATSYAESGADVVAPSSMMDGQVIRIRSALNTSGFKDTKIMAFSAKHASSLYSPFRMTAYNKNIRDYTTIDKSSYQIGCANPRQAIREIEADIQEGADAIIVKPTLAYLDMVSMIRDNIDFPLVVQNVSGEYAMIKAAATRGWINEEEWKVNSIAAMKRAGADSIISYFTMDIAKYLDH